VQNSVQKFSKKLLQRVGAQAPMYEPCGSDIHHNLVYKDSKAIGVWHD